MSIGSRIKEARTKIGITQEELAKNIGVTKGAIANYENEVSTPKVELLFKLFTALNCDANYLYQDEMKSLKEDRASIDEMEKLIYKYRDLDNHGKEMVDLVLLKEWERVIKQEDKIIPIKKEEPVNELFAAHTDDQSPENIKLMMDEFDGFDDLP